MHTVHCQKKVVLPEALRVALGQARHPMALTGAGISVASGIPDFRSSGGVWSIFNPQEFATLRVFQQNPGKAWQLYRALGKILQGAKPNKAHKALSRLQQLHWLKSLVTQNVDGLHQDAGSEGCLEIHGNHRMLHCPACTYRRPVQPDDLICEPYPGCPVCDQPLKPHIVLFGEAVHAMEDIFQAAQHADILLVIGTSGSVYPAADIPYIVHGNGGVILEFNLESSLGVTAGSRLTDFHFPGKVTDSLPYFTEQLEAVLHL